LCFGEL
jgi:hypothetical protein